MRCAPRSVRTIWSDGQRPSSTRSSGAARLSKTPPPRLQPTELPASMPRGLLPAMLARGRMLLCLDYDGTISDIVANPADARPLNGVDEILTSLSHDPARLRVAIVTGREIAEVQRMLGLNHGIMFSGTHGLEIV